MEAQPDHQVHVSGAEALRIGVVVVLVVLLTGIAFVGGYLVGSVSGTGTSAYRLDPNGTPVPAAGSNTQGHPAFALYWEVWNILQREYYGDLPDDQKMTYGATQNDFFFFCSFHIAEYFSCVVIPTGPSYIPPSI